MDTFDQDKLIQLILERDNFIRQLKTQIAGLEDSLHHEMLVNENLNDMNIALKEQLSFHQTGKKSNVIPHPTTIKKLTDAVARYANRIEELTESLIFAIDMIPVNRNVSMHIERLKLIAHKLA